MNRMKICIGLGPRLALAVLAAIILAHRPAMAEEYLYPHAERRSGPWGQKPHPRHDPVAIADAQPAPDQVQLEAANVVGCRRIG